ncbi:MAG: hypothetical protein CVU11_16785 [Bacteroidetes bacterium HGW-Bacteroidetes-6]|jgi:hypothetical protein|nr:MAG: hypothetical protein CVU14_12165 [Bacteroidetes bacterium HGW-Bacteroidetes-9]PKP00906.1 MAG: hypothetical protein CVU11_16785 [Bacteroidetes bacterium HGW-Bacteroidetes-6]
MKNLFFVLLMGCIVIFSCVNKKTPEEKNLFEIVMIQDLQNEYIVENSRVNIESSYLFSDSSFLKRHKDSYENYKVLYNKVKELNEYISQTKLALINNNHVNVVNITDSLNLLKNSILDFQAKKISELVKEQYLKEIKDLNIDQNIILEDDFGVTYQLLYLSMIQSKFSLLLSHFGAFEFIGN